MYVFVYLTSSLSCLFVLSCFFVLLLHCFADCVAELLEFAAFIKLRVSHPELYRPYAIPLGTVGCALLLLPASAFVILLALMSSSTTWLVSGAAIVVGLVLYPALQHASRHGWCAFRGMTCREVVGTEGLAPCVID